MTTNSRKFGVEIEFFCSNHTYYSLAEKLTEAGIECVAPGYSHTTMRKWKLVPDGSVSGGMELVSPPISGDEAFNSIRLACDVLEREGATVNRSCGLHVHIDMTSANVQTFKKLTDLYIQYEIVIDSLQPQSRRANNNTYCQSVKDTRKAALQSASSVQAIAQAINRGSRYAKLNVTSYWKHGTVEFRQHSGTTSATKIIQWVQLCLRMVEAAHRDQQKSLEFASTNNEQLILNRRNRRLARLLQENPNGINNAFASNALGSDVCLGYELRIAGIPHRAVRQGRRIQYFAAAVTTANAEVATLAKFADHMELPQEDRIFWEARAVELA